MIKSLLICDSEGFPFYSRTIDKAFEKIDKAILSGLISAIGVIGKQLFNEEVATITYGSGLYAENIVVVSKEILTSNKVIYFVFFVKEDFNLKLMNQIATSIFIEVKPILKDKTKANASVNTKIDNILDVKFHGLIAISKK